MRLIPNLRQWLNGAALGCLISSSVVAANTNGVVASGHPLATAAGLSVLKGGGNAVDAAVAVGLTLGVVDSANSGLGGGCMMLIRQADGRIVAIDGRETAPAAATRDMFVREGMADPRLSRTGALASGVPGELAAFDHALKHYGRKPLSELILPAADLAEKGFGVSAAYAARLQEVTNEIASFPDSRAIFFMEGKPLETGDVLRQPDLAATYRAIATHGPDWFYRGPFAEATARWMTNHGGLLTQRDFEDYRSIEREPVTTTYRDWQVVSFPPPSSGGVHIAQMLNILEHFDLSTLDESARLHVMGETMKLAFADRAHWLGDPDFADVPRGLVSKDYAVDQAKLINLDRASEVASYGQPPGWETNLFRKHTTHFSLADAEGNWVACTATINTAFGSKVVIPGTGVLLNNQMDDFSAQPGVANHFGLVGAAANSVAPGKRPLSSMSPTIVLKEEQPMLALGGAGGPRIITAVLMVLVNMCDLGLGPEAAVAAPRIHHQWSPNALLCEPDVPERVCVALVSRGQALERSSGLGVVQLVARTEDGTAFLGAADPRGGGSAEGW
jgi:gamma-glutamyltranspeptidase/glutathione hydrolase